MKIPRPSRLSGFTLTEVMVAMAIALIGIVMMFQIIENSETRKRTTGAGSDAQISGAIAMYALERDLRMSGNGIGGLPPASLNLNCTCVDDTRACNFRLQPVFIENGADGAPDTITTFYGNSDLAPTILNYNASADRSKSLDSNNGNSRGGLMNGDLLLAVSNNRCTVIEITSNNNSDARTIDHGNASYTRHYPAVKVDTPNDNDYEYSSGAAPAAAPTPRYNSVAFNPGASGSLFQLGRRDLPRNNIWAINAATGNLTVTDRLHADTAFDVGEGVVNMQAMYGLSTTTPVTWSDATPANWSTVVAIRVALLVRSQQYEKENVNRNADGSDKVPAWSGGDFVMTNVDGTPDSGVNNDSPNNWRRYRYHVYETSIPLRNNIWGRSSS